jgi:hypothetical protein
VTFLSSFDTKAAPWLDFGGPSGYSPRNGSFAFYFLLDLARRANSSRNFDHVTADGGRHR